MTGTASTLTLNDVRKVYGDFVLEVAMEVRAGAFLSLVGPSGSGKSSTLRLIAGFDSPDAGAVVLGGDDISDKPPWRRGFGFVPQDHILFPHLSVYGNIAYGLRAAGVSARETKHKVRELVEMVGLSGFDDRRIETLSGGERQRVALARALAIDPSVLLLDEPFSALDAPLRREMRDEVRNINIKLGVSVIFVTHNQDEALSVSDKLVLMRDGKIVQAGTPEELYRRPVNLFTAEFIGTANTFPVGITSVTGSKITVQGDHQFTIERFADGLDLDRSAGFYVLVRPHDFSFGSPGEANSIEAEVQSRRFLGDRYEYVCSSSSGTVAVLTDRRREIGEKVYPVFKSADGYLLAKDPV